jgi:hypothetical protein
MILSIFILNSFISLFMVLSASLWYIFRTPMSSFICFCIFSYSLFLLFGISWVPPVHFGWPCLVTSPWNSQWLLAIFLLSVCSCGFFWVPWHSLSLFCWSPELGISFLHFPLNPVLIYLGEENGFHPFFIFPSRHFMLFLFLVCV